MFSFRARAAFQPRALLWAALALAVLPGCTLLMRDTPAPIPTLLRPLAASGRAATLVVFLPGRGDTMANYEEAGILTTMGEAGVKADAILVDAHLGYYFNRTMVERLRADVLLPARQQGYRRIVVVGVSIGGLGALLLERDHPGSADALVLLSPYLGVKAAFFERIVAAGGPESWAAGREPSAGPIEEQVWTFLGTKTSALPPTWLSFGGEDRYARGHRLFAPLLPETRVNTIPGGHDWKTWRALWRDLCFKSDLFQAERAGGAAPAR
jgi:pimeloyl-ACP methyl ester carboxylesterase